MALVRQLPDEVLSLICADLGQRREFPALFRCALSSVSLAEPALRTLYRLHDQSPAFSPSDDLEVVRNRQKSDFRTKVAERELLFRKWLQLWRSIVISTLETTYKPYCRYIRILDFRNLFNLFEDTKFYNFKDEFFSHGLEQFYHARQELFSRHIKGTSKRLAVQSIDPFPTLNAIGEAVTQKTTLLEELTGNLSRRFLPQWVARSPRLKSMVLWNGNALGDGVEDSIRDNCPTFASLTLVEWLESDADETFARFISGLRPNSLEYFELISFSNLGSLSFSAFSSHQSSLTELKLESLHEDAILALGQLKGCTALRVLVLGDNRGTLQLEATQNHVFLEIVAWLSSCTELKDLTLKKFWDCASILAQVLCAPDVLLTKLSVEGYKVTGSATFHASLPEQPQLQSVWLKGDGEDTPDSDIEMMVDSLCRLKNLHELVLKDCSDMFEEMHIARLAVELPLLEDFWTSGQTVSSDILGYLENLKYLKNLTLYALTEFTFQNIVDFISQLDEQKQRGFSLSIMASDTEYDLTEEEQNCIRELLKTKLDGRFDFVLWRDADPSESDSD